LILVFGLCGIALVLATPLISFNAISTRDQVARLESGKTAPDKFDWRALAFDFGEAGKAALKRLAASPNAAIRAKAVEVAKAENRWDVGERVQADRHRNAMAAYLRILPAGTAMPAALRDAMAKDTPCYGWKCTLVILPGGTEAILLNNGSFAQPAPEAEAKPAAPPVRSRRYGSAPGFAAHYRLVDGKWTTQAFEDGTRAEQKAKADGYAKGQIEVRPVTRRQVFVGGVPVDDAFE
jgi:hypothetical protein